MLNKVESISGITIINNQKNKKRENKQKDKKQKKPSFQKELDEAIKKENEPEIGMFNAKA